MKLNSALRSRKSLGPLLSAAAIAVSTPAIAEEGAAETPFVTGTLSLMVDTHFISYGQDVWAAGNSWRDPLFHPSIELNFNFGNGFKGILGTWWDVNDNADSSIGNAIQEVDVWLGVGYAYENWSFTALYQEWLYANQSERILDFKVAYAHWLNPSLTLHARVDGAEPFDEGLVTVLGIAPGKTFEDLANLTVSIPVNVSFDTDNYHGGDAGFGFASVGVAASVPLAFMPGSWSLNAGVTLYHTNDEVIPGNPDETFVTGSMGVALAF